MNLTALALIIAAFAGGKYTGGEGYAGIGVRDQAFDTPKVRLESPVGIISYDYQVGDNVEIFAQHLSGATDNNDGYGMNVVGVKYKFK